jgi:hypothetical protein
MWVRGNRAHAIEDGQRACLSFSVVPRWRLGVLQGLIGRPHLERALRILKDLDAANRLDANRKGWSAEIEALLAG